MDDFDIYGDLDDVDYKAENEKLHSEIEELKQKLAEVQSRCSDLLAANNTLRSKEVTYQKNFSSLLLTARTEVDRKDRQMEEIRKKNSAGGLGDSRIVITKCSKATQTCENGLRKELDHKLNGRKRSHSPKETHERPSKRYRNQSGDERRRDNKYVGRQQDTRRREDQHKRADGRSQRSDDSRRKRRSSERRDFSKETRGSERAKNSDGKQQKRSNNSPAKPDIKRSKEKEIPKTLPEKSKKPLEEPLPEEKLPDAPKIPPPSSTQTGEQTQLPTLDSLEDTRTQKLLSNDPTSGNGEPSICLKPLNDGFKQCVDDTQKQQQLLIDRPDQKTTYVDGVDENAENESHGNRSLNTSGQSGRSYVIEVVNENEFECFVSLNRKKKRKKERRNRIDQIE